MRKFLVLSLPVVLIAGFALVNSGESVYAAGVPEDNNPSWAKKLPTTTRFIVLSEWNNEAVLDRETGLVWARSPLPLTLSGDGAVFACAQDRTGNRMGWRVPSLHELASLADPTVPPPGPFLPPGHPFLNVSIPPSGGLTFWTQTSWLQNPTFAFSVNLSSLLPLLGRCCGVQLSPKAALLSVWCVRSGGIQSAL